MTYEVFLEPEVHRARLQLPGNVRQRFRRIISALQTDPRPPRSQTLDAEGLDLPTAIEVRRFRLDPWRLIYAINDTDRWVWLLALRERPPYDYQDLADLLSRVRG